MRDTLNGAVRFDSSEELARSIILKKLEVIERHLDGRTHFVGDVFTMADLAWFTRINALPALGIDLEETRFPNMRRWSSRSASAGPLPARSQDRRLPTM